METLEKANRKGDKHALGRMTRQHKAAPLADNTIDDDYVPENPTLEELLQASADVRSGRVKTIPWEQVEAELDAVQN